MLKVTIAGACLGMTVVSTGTRTLLRMSHHKHTMHAATFDLTLFFPVVPVFIICASFHHGVNCCHAILVMQNLYEVEKQR